MWTEKTKNLTQNDLLGWEDLLLTFIVHVGIERVPDALFCFVLGASAGQPGPRARPQTGVYGCG